jgi:tetratricopeptide (TPR) repeat protein
MAWARRIFTRFTGAGEKDTRASMARDWKRRGNEALAAGRLAEAASSYAQGLEADPQDPTFRVNLGFVLLEQGDAGGAAKQLGQALAMAHADDGFVHEAHYLLGRAHAQLDHLEDALASFRAALHIKPDFAEPIEECVRALHRLGRHLEAAESARRLAQLRPSSFAQLLVATQLSLAGELHEAAEIGRRVCEAEPANFEASALRFDALVKLGRAEEALQEAERALHAIGPNGSALIHAGVALNKLGRLEESLVRFEQALRLEPANHDAVLNKGTALLAQLRVPEAAGAAREGLRLHPQSADLHWLLSITAFLQGDLETGWRESEWRAHLPAFAKPPAESNGTRWQGESLEGRSIFLHGEQGFGDNIQFVRYVPLVAARAKQVYLLVPAQLEPLVAALAPNCVLLPQGARLPPVDFHCSLMSLPAFLGTTLDTIPAQIPYLHADPQRVRAWRERLGCGSVNVGMAWSGSPTHGNDHNRSMTLEVFRQAAAPGCRFVTVQPQVRDADRPTLQAWSEALDLGAQVRDFGDSAALVEALDLVVTVDTSVAHLAGALGKPVWILLPYSPDWRWMLDREDTPWYPSARLYRQPRPQAWDAVIDRVRRDLEALARAR